MKWVTWILVTALIGLQYDLWLAKGSWRDMWRLQNAVSAQNTRNEGLIQRNKTLTAEIKDLTHGQDAIAEIARVDLGYVRNGETFYRFVHDSK